MPTPTSIIGCARLAAIIAGVRLESLGMRRSRGPSATKLAKQATGLRTNDRAKLIEALRAKIDADLAAQAAAKIT
jgi:hypothetical protein